MKLPFSPMSHPNEPKEVQEVRNLIQEIQGKDFMKGQDAIVDLANEYRARYAEWETTHLYHALAGSSPGKPMSALDFPGGDSVLERLKKIFNAL